MGRYWGNDTPDDDARPVAVEVAGEPPRALLREIGEGLAFVAREPVLRTVVTAGSMVNIGIAGVTTLLPVLTLKQLGWSQGQFGTFLGAGGVGGLIGALSAVRLASAWGAGRAVLIVGIAVGPLAFALPLLGQPVPGPLAAAGWGLVLFKVGFRWAMAATATWIPIALSPLRRMSTLEPANGQPPPDLGAADSAGSTRRA